MCLCFFFTHKHLPNSSLEMAHRAHAYYHIERQTYRTQTDMLKHNTSPIIWTYRKHIDTKRAVHLFIAGIKSLQTNIISSRIIKRMIRGGPLPADQNVCAWFPVTTVLKSSKSVTIVVKDVEENTRKLNPMGHRSIKLKYLHIWVIANRPEIFQVLFQPGMQIGLTLICNKQWIIYFLGLFKSK